MHENSSENTTTSANDRPPDGRCLDCQMAVVPFLRPAVLGLPPKWMGPASLCQFCLEKREEQEAVLAKQKILDEAFDNSKVSPRFKKRTFENFCPTPGTEKAYQAAQRYQLTDGGFVFVGPCGVGKTHLAAAIANRFLGKNPLLFLSCPEFLLELRESITNKKKDITQHLLSLARNVQLLVLDDIGAEKPSEWVQETLFVLINHRYEHILPTIFTTNCSLSDLEERLGKRITSRLIEMGRCIRMDGDDWRVKERRQKMEGGHAR